MMVGSPASPKKLRIKKHYKVLDIGSGDFPHPAAQVCVDKYVADNTHRTTGIKVLPHQKFIQADGESLPFADKEFDYVISQHVLEHVDDPEKFIREMIRVGKRGFLATPSLIGEFLVPKDSHKWVLMCIDQKVVMYEKSLIMSAGPDFGELFLNYFPRHSIAWKMLQRTHHQLLVMHYEWEDSIEYLINPKDDKYLQYFFKPWTLENTMAHMPSRSLGGESTQALKAFYDILKSVFRSKILRNKL